MFAGLANDGVDISFYLPTDAALLLRQLAETGNPGLTGLGVVSVSLDDDSGNCNPSDGITAPGAITVTDNVSPPNINAIDFDTCHASDPDKPSFNAVNSFRANILELFGVRKVNMEVVKDKKDEFAVSEAASIFRMPQFPPHNLEKDTMATPPVSENEKLSVYEEKYPLLAQGISAVVRRTGEGFKQFEQQDIGKFNRPWQREKENETMPANEFVRPPFNRPRTPPIPTQESGQLSNSNQPFLMPLPLAPSHPQCSRPSPMPVLAPHSQTVYSQSFPFPSPHVQNNLSHFPALPLRYPFIEHPQSASCRPMGSVASSSPFLTSLLKTDAQHQQLVPTHPPGTETRQDEELSDAALPPKKRKKRRNKQVEAIERPDLDTGATDETPCQQVVANRPTLHLIPIRETELSESTRYTGNVSSHELLSKSTKLYSMADGELKAKDIEINPCVSLPSSVIIERESGLFLDKQERDNDCYDHRSRVPTYDFVERTPRGQEGLPEI